MSANNAIVILKSKKGYQVSHVGNPFNLDTNNLNTFDYWFKDKPFIQNKDLALLKAEKLKSEIKNNPYGNGIIEYGIMFIDITPYQREKNFSLKLYLNL